MPCEKCPERRAMYCSDADLILCPLCYETWADDHAQEQEADARAAAEERAAEADELLRKLGVAFESPLVRPTNRPLTTRH